jgi:hypothetical protein
MVEGLELTLVQLENMEKNGIEIVCMSCYSSEEECICEDKTPWPIEHVILRLRAILREKP